MKVWLSTEHIYSNPGGMQLHVRSAGLPGPPTPLLSNSLNFKLIPQFVLRLHGLAGDSPACRSQIPLYCSCHHWVGQPGLQLQVG